MLHGTALPEALSAYTPMIFTPCMPRCSYRSEKPSSL